MRNKKECQTLENSLNSMVMVCKKIYVDNRVILASTLVFGLFAHMFAFTNKLVNGDEIYCLFSKGATTVSGRWGLSVMSAIFPDVSLPWIYGVITLLILAIAISFIAKLLEIRHSFLQILLSGLVITFPSLTGTFCYMFTSTSYAVSFLLAVVAVVLFQKYNLIYFICGSICTVFSLSIYQAYVSIITSLMLLVLINNVLRKTIDIKELVIHGFYMLGGLIAAAVIYWGVTQSIQNFLNTGLGTYAAEAMAPDNDSFIKNLIAIIQIWILYFFNGYNAMMPTCFSRLIHLLCFFIAGIKLLKWMLLNRVFWKNLLLIVFLAGLPFSINCIYMICRSGSIHTLVLYSFVTTYILILIILQNGVNESVSNMSLAFSKLMIFGMGLIILMNSYISNEAYLKLKLRYENCYSICNTILSQIHMTPGYTKDTPVAFLGEYEEPKFYKNNLSDISQLMGTSGVAPTSYSIDRMFTYYLGQPLNFVDDETKNHLLDSPVYEKMPSYPDYGSIAVIDDVVVVKFPDIE